MAQSLAMDAGLSQRTQKALRELLPTFAAGALQQQQQQQPPHITDPFPPTIDLSRGLNEAIHPELLEFFHSTLEDNIANEVPSPRPSKVVLAH